MALKHFVYSKESANNTWTTPAKWLWVNSAQVGSKRDVLPYRTTGVGRDIQQNVLGAKPVNGPVKLPWWFTNVGTLFHSFMTDLTTTAAGASYDHALLYNDAALFDTLSLQQQYNSSFGVNILGAAVNAVTIEAITKQQIGLTFDMIAKDEAKCGGTFEDGTTSSAALLGTPAYPALNRGFLFYDAIINIGGTTDLDGATKKISLADADEVIKLRNLSIKISNNLDADAYGLTMDPTLIEQSPGDRNIDVTFDMSWLDYSSTFYDAGRAGTAMALEMILQGPGIETTNHYEAHICIPSLYINPMDLPEISGDNKTPMLPIKAAGQLDQVTGVSAGLWLRTSEATL
jgi:hypothetical protein